MRLRLWCYFLNFIEKFVHFLCDGFNLHPIGLTVFACCVALGVILSLFIFLIMKGFYLLKKCYMLICYFY